MTPEREAAVGLLYEYGAALIAEKRAVPCPDMLSTVIHAELPDADPPRLSDDELSAFFSLLFSAGAETTRNAIAGAMLAFLEWPEQLDLLRSGRASDGHRGGGDPALDDTVALQAQDGDQHLRSSAARASVPARRWSSGRARPTGIRGASTSPTRFCCSATPTRTWPSATASTSASARTSPASRSAWRSKRCSVPSTSFTLAAPAEWTRSNRHTGIRHLPVAVAQGRPQHPRRPPACDVGTHKSRLHSRIDPPVLERKKTSADGANLLHFRSDRSTAAGSPRAEVHDNDAAAQDNA